MFKMGRKKIGEVKKYHFYISDVQGMKAGEWWGGTRGRSSASCFWAASALHLLLSYNCFDIAHRYSIYFSVDNLVGATNLLLSYLFRRISGVVASNELFCAWSFMWHGNSVEPQRFKSCQYWKQQQTAAKAASMGIHWSPGTRLLKRTGWLDLYHKSTIRNQTRSKTHYQYTLQQRGLHAINPI